MEFKVLFKSVRHASLLTSEEMELQMFSVLVASVSYATIELLNCYNKMIINSEIWHLQICCSKILFNCK